MTPQLQVLIVIFAGFTTLTIARCAWLYFTSENVRIAPIPDQRDQRDINRPHILP